MKALIREKLNQYRWLPPLVLVGLFMAAKAVSYTLPRLVWTWMELILFLCMAVYCALFPKLADQQSEKETKHKWDITTLMFLFAFMILFNDAMYYGFLDGNRFPFFLVSLALGLPVGAGLTLLYKGKDSTIKTVIGFLIFFWLLSFFALNAILIHLNYTLDMQPPEEYTVVIEDKEYRHVRKGGSTYKLEMTVDGERISLEVRSGEYHAYEEGDEYTVLKYGGAFGEPFVLPKE